jgi:hypothetical protein
MKFGARRVVKGMQQGSEFRLIAQWQPESQPQVVGFGQCAYGF